MYKYDGQYENSKLLVSNQKILLIGLIVTTVAILFVQTGPLKSGIIQFLM